MSFLSPNLEMCIHFLYSVTIYNDSAFYFTEIIVLIRWEDTPTQIRMRIGSITFHALWSGGGGGHEGSIYLFYVKILKYLSQAMRKFVLFHMQTTKEQISLRFRTV